MYSSESIGSALQERVQGEVRTDERTLARHATDQSMYEVRPLAVVYPRDLDDVVAVVRFAREAGVPLTPRGRGSGTAGAALGRGILLSFAKPCPMERILGFEEHGGEPRATVEPGLLHDDLQAFLRERGLYLPADPSSGAISLLGGNVATKASGPHALKHGSIDRYLRHVQFVTAAGEVVNTADETSIPEAIRDGVLALRDDVLGDAGAVRRLESRRDMKLASGYNLFTFLRHRQVGEMVAQLLVGSVGTLGVVTRATLRAEPYIEGKATTLLYFCDLAQAGEAVLHIKALDVAAIEIVNHTSLTIVKERRPELDLPGGEAHMLLVEYEGPERYDQIAEVEKLVRANDYDLAGPLVSVEDEEERERLWKVRKALLPTVRAYRRDRKALSVVNDVGVDVAHLADLIRDVEAIFARLGLVAAIYGHAGSGNLHLRPLFEVGDPELRSLLTRVAEEVYGTVLGYGGTITAEHGMGRLRAPFLEREWGPTMTGYMRRVKAVFDPDDVLNPEVMFSDRALTDDMKPL
jgi:FAD/FMN-containing dehydrogenase